MLKGISTITPVDLVIEPIDLIEIAAWAAESQDNLSVARKSLYLEIPVYDALGSVPVPVAYARILGDLVIQISRLLVNK